MIYTDVQLREKIYEMLKDFETEVVEFKEANNSYSFKDIGKYFSALGNEANIRGKNEAWLIFGITNKGEFKGSDYRKSGNPQSLKKIFKSPSKNEDGRNCWCVWQSCSCRMVSC